MIIDVLVELKSKKIDKTFSYLVPKRLEQDIEIGKRVLVPFGKQKLEGFILGTNHNHIDFELKQIYEVIDEHAVLNEELLVLGKYISKKTLCNLISAYQTMLPTALKAKNGTVIPKKYVSYISLNDDKYIPKNDKQKAILDMVKNSKIEKKKLADISISSLNTLIKNNVLKETKIESYRLKNDTDIVRNNVELTDEQKNVISKVKDNIFKSYLLHGVTGSGKTEVYMQLIERVLKEKKEAIVLVPEISLTPQLVDVFKKRFGSRIAILHSRLSMGEKYDEWRKIERGEVSIVIGARSAIFAPLTKLGIIIIDEEHSSTYKQDNNPKYNAIDIAIWRAKRYNISIVLGSATPSIESYTRAKLGIYELCEMKKRVNQSYPKVTLIDMKDEIKKGNRIISSLLRDKINEKLSKNEQVMLFLNRRGYSTISTCKSCGFTHKCPNCDIPLTYHKSSNKMRCHYCGYGSFKLTTCPKCKGNNINNLGLGTEKLEQYIKDNFKEAKVIRMDQDTTTKKGSHERIISSFQNKEYNVLIGTQMISKGLDFGSVTLVGVINGDSSLNIPDFRSAERTFQLLNQVSGRAGRKDKNGEVIIQGFNCDHYSIKAASNNDYKTFYKEELNLRKILKYSPYYNLCLIKVKSKNEKETSIEATKIANHLRKQNLANVIVLGPSPSIIPKINQIYFYQITLKFKNTDEIMEELKFINEHYRLHRVNVEIDINPIRL